MKYSLSIWCRALAIVAWIGALAWFGVATMAAWGFTPGSLLLWSLPAVLLLRATLAWWAGVGQPVSPPLHEWLKRVWRNLAIAAAAFYFLAALLGAVIGDTPVFQAVFGVILLVLGTLCAVFPVAVTLWAIRRTFRLRGAVAEHPREAI